MTLYIVPAHYMCALTGSQQGGASLMIQNHGRAARFGTLSEASLGSASASASAQHFLVPAPIPYSPPARAQQYVWRMQLLRMVSVSARAWCLDVCRPGGQHATLAPTARSCVLWVE